MIKITTSECNLTQIYDSGQCFRMKPAGEDWYEIIARDRYLRIRQDNELLIFDCSEEAYTFWYDYFDLGTDYGSFLARINPNDKYLNRAAEAGRGVRLLRQDLWETIVSFLISQQNNIKRIRYCIDNICREYGRQCLSSDGRPYYAFPEPEALALSDPDALKACNLGYRSKYVVKTAQSIAEGRIDLDRIRNMPYHRAKKELLSCYGIGEKVAECICLFSLHHFQAFPVDTHIRQALETHYKRGFPHRRYKDCQGVIQQYIFYYELNKPSDRTGQT